MGDHGGYELIVLGASWGGLDAVGRILDGLPDGFGCAVALVQHRGPRRSALASLLARHTGWPVHEVCDKDPIRPATLAVAPPDYHLLVEPGCYALSTDAPVRHSRPSVDVLFESAADSYGERVIGVVLTGANADGARGLARIRDRGGYTIVQDPSTAASESMPLAALDRLAPDALLPLDGIAEHLTALCRAGEPVPPAGARP